MILVDTSVWIDHLHRSVPQLVDLLDEDQVGCHPMVVEELALGSIASRSATLGALSNLFGFARLTHGELLVLVDAHRLWGRGLGAVDAHLLGAVRIVPGSTLWTRDRRLRDAAHDLGVGFTEGAG